MTFEPQPIGTDSISSTSVHNTHNFLESRFVTIQEAETKCPHGIRLFNTNEAVTRYNSKILNLAQEKTISIAKDVFTGCTSAEQTTSFRQKLHKMSLIDTGGLPYETVFVVNVFYMITTNIDVSNGLANGAVGRLVHIEYNGDRDVNVAWLEFPNSLKIGQKIRRKVAGHVAAHQISKTAVPITRRSSTISLNNSKTINVKRSHLPLVCAWQQLFISRKGVHTLKLSMNMIKHIPYH
ncbi:uncharacterized protein LOC141531229 [Cotesia typhae]|uniref:uncharacterized protein LOC141531229 n=1 Tax=Cotesia typhae TaxID=2053667 RepID=UPI003D680B7D